MKVKSIASKIEELRKIVSGWSEGAKIADIEMDMAISRTQEIYELLKYSDQEEEEVTEEIEEIEEEEIEEIEIEEVEAAVEEIAAEPVVEIELEPEPEVEIEPEPEPKAEPETSEAEQKKIRIQKFMSLYKDEAEEEVMVEPKEEKPAPKPTSRELLDMLSLNDRLLLSNDLFDGDTSKMEQLMLVLGAMPTLDDALIYIAQRHKWRGDNEGAKLLFSLLKNKYTNS